MSALVNDPDELVVEVGQAVWVVALFFATGADTVAGART